MTKERQLTTDSIYHVYNRGVAKQQIFHDDVDFRQFLRTLSFYLEPSSFHGLADAKKRPEALAEYLAAPTSSPRALIHAYCLMPNHFHLLLQQVKDDGISNLLRLAQLSYTRYYNMRYTRVGPLLQGSFQAVPVTSDQQFLHVSRYIHLNPFVAKLVAKPKDYPWSSLGQYLSEKENRLCTPALLLHMSGGATSYLEFLTDYASYAQDIHAIKDCLIDT